MLFCICSIAPSIVYATVLYVLDWIGWMFVTAHAVANMALIASFVAWVLPGALMHVESITGTVWRPEQQTGSRGALALQHIISPFSLHVDAI